MKIRNIFPVLTLAGLMTFQAGALLAQDAQGGHGQPEPPMAGVHWARGQKPESPGNSQGAAAHGKPVKSPNLTWHGGPVMHDTTVVTPIFWGPSWSDTNFAADKITGLASFYGSLGNTDYANTNGEYAGSNGQVSTGVTYTGSCSKTKMVGACVDIASAPSNGNQTGPILTEVCKMIDSPVANGYYPVYVDTPRGAAGFCAWHSASTCGSNNTPVQFAFFFNLDGDAGCDPQDTSVETNHLQGLEALANVSGHEFSEMLTDPRLDAWFDSTGAENSDKCAWAFGSPFVTFTNGSKWKIQGNWSNAAYTAGTGFANRSGEKGCIDGGNFK